MKTSKALLTVITALSVFACSKQNPPDLRPKSGVAGQTAGTTKPTSEVTKEDKKTTTQTSAPEDITNSLAPDLAAYIKTVNGILSQKGKPALRVTAAMNKAAEENGKKNIAQLKDKTYALGSIADPAGTLPMILTNLPADKMIEQNDLVKGIQDADVNVIGIAQIPNEKADGKVTAMIMAKEPTASANSTNQTTEQTQGERQQ